MAFILSCIYILNNLAGKLQVDGHENLQVDGPKVTSFKPQNYNLMAPKGFISSHREDNPT
jgi:hypothetical protein